MLPRLKTAEDGKTIHRSHQRRGSRKKGTEDEI
jgi:hypothetical protein